MSHALHGNAQEEVLVDQSELPSATNLTFSESAFIAKNCGKTLPSPDEVRKQAVANGLDVSQTFRPDPVKFPDLGLLVKWGTDVTIAEGQCLWFMRNYMRDKVPVPEIYGWRCDEETTFLYMELVDGDTLEARWPTLAEADRTRVCTQLRDIVQRLRQLKRNQTHSTISNISGQSIRDVMFYIGGSYPAGPFASIAAFHEAFARLAERVCTLTDIDPRKHVKELSGLGDDVDVVFTHGDLDQSNILVSKAGSGPARIVAIIDWHQSGWYPEPWEELKAHSVAYPDLDWKNYIPMQPTKKEYTYSWTFVDMALI